MLTLRVEKLRKEFGSFVAVDDISFSVGEGEIVGLLGPNGAGKTTTIAMLLGIVTPTSGEIRIFEKDFPSHRQEILARMNYSSAYTKAPWRMTVWEYLYINALLYSVLNPKERIDKLLAAFRLETHRDTQAGDLSAGNAARLNLAKAFINYPKLVLLDEPTSSLDPDIAQSVREYILKVQEKYKTTVLITSHNMAEIEELADRVIFINHGKIISQGTPEKLARSLVTTRVKMFMRDGQKRTLEYCRSHKLPAEVSDRYVVIETREQDVAKLLTGLAEIGVDYTEISINKPTLEDYFLQEVRDEK